MDLNIEEMLTDGSFVEKYYQMDPETEDLIRSYVVRDGMRVLIESTSIKSDLDPEKLENLEELNRALTYNRWATVTELAWSRKDGILSFIALYDDGTKKTFSVGFAHNWIVKLDSIPQKEAGGSLFDMFRLMGMVVVSGTPEEMADQVIDGLRDMGMKFQDDSEPEKKVHPAGTEWDIDANRPMAETQKLEEDEIAAFNAGVQSEDPSWVQQLEGKWRDEKGTSTIDPKLI